MPVSYCSCGKMIDGASSASGMKKMPKPDDVSICIACGHFLQFDANLLAVPIKELPADIDDESREMITNVQRHIRSMLS